MLVIKDDSFDLTKIFGAPGPRCLVICLMCAFTTMCCYLLASKVLLEQLIIVWSDYTHP